MHLTTVQLFIVVVMPGTHVTTTVQKFIVVVMPGTHVTTTVQIFIVREGGREEGRILKSSLNSLKIGYVIAEHLYFGKFRLDL